MSQHVSPSVVRPRFGLAGAAAMVAICVSALALTAAGPGGDPTAPAVAVAPAALKAPKCVLCSRAFADKLARLCSTCDRGKCFSCGAAFPDEVARVCSTCDKGKCIGCGRAFPDKTARLCNRCSN